MKITNLSASTFLFGEKRIEPGETSSDDLGFSSEDTKRFKDDKTVKAWVNAKLMSVEGVEPDKGSNAAKATNGLSTKETDNAKNAAQAKANEKSS